MQPLGLRAVDFRDALGTNPELRALRGTLHERPLARARLKFVQEEIIMVRKIIAIVALTSSLALAACNTVRGAGEDLESAANAVDNKT